MLRPWCTWLRPFLWMNCGVWISRVVVFIIVCPFVLFLLDFVINVFCFHQSLLNTTLWDGFAGLWVTDKLSTITRHIQTPQLIRRKSTNTTKTVGELECSGWVSSSCCIYETRCVNYYIIPLFNVKYSVVTYSQDQLSNDYFFISNI
jgi:hypothetical protein